MVHHVHTKKLNVFEVLTCNLATTTAVHLIAIFVEFVQRDHWEVEEENFQDINQLVPKVVVEGVTVPVPHLFQIRRLNCVLPG